MRLVLAIAVCTLPFAGGAHASDQASDIVVDGTKVVCKKDRQAADLGSNLRRSSKKVCKTQSQWDELERDAKATFRRIDDTATRTAAPEGRGQSPF